MELLANDLSFDCQFTSVSSFCEALKRLLGLRAVAAKFEREIHCHSRFKSLQPVQGIPIQNAIQLLEKNRVRAFMNWIDKAGPFWDQTQQQDSDVWLECKGQLVTDTSIGEAAFRTINGFDCDLVSLTPSDWDDSYLDVKSSDDSMKVFVDIRNWCRLEGFEEHLKATEPPIRSWNDLKIRALARTTGLRFSGDCFDPLDGVPFSKVCADRFLNLLITLDRLTNAFDQDGSRTETFHEIRRNYFMGANAAFSDSSPTEKNRFQKELTFKNPDSPSEELFCTWHGKVWHETLRLHYYWEYRPGEPVYVVYLGQKITRK